VAEFSKEIYISSGAVLPVMMKMMTMMMMMMMKYFY
jgi:hypothetical protein